MSPSLLAALLRQRTTTRLLAESGRREYGDPARWPADYHSPHTLLRRYGRSGI